MDGNTDELADEKLTTPQEKLTTVDKIKKKVSQFNTLKPGCKKIGKLEDPSNKKTLVVAFKVNARDQKRVYKILEARFDKKLSGSLSQMFMQIIDYIEPNENGEFYTGN